MLRTNYSVRLVNTEGKRAALFAVLLVCLCLPHVKAQEASKSQSAIHTMEIPERSAGSYIDEIKAAQTLKTIIPRESITSMATDDPEPNAPPLKGAIEGINFDENAALNGSYFIPPDPHGAAGPGHVVSVTNCSIEWFTKAGVNEKSDALSSFFGSLAPLTATFDPKVIYDQYAGRFVVITLERTSIFLGAASNTSRILVAVSDDGDPNGMWYFHAIDAKTIVGITDFWADYPGLAVDEEAIYITCNLFSFSAGAYGGARLWIVHKTPLYGGGPATVTVHDPSTAVGVSATTTQPAHMFGAGPAGVGTFLVRYSGFTDGVGEYLSIIRVDAPLTAPTFTHQFVGLGNIDATATVTLPDAPQLGSAALIDTGDRRALHAVWRGHALWVTMHVLPGSGPNAGEVTAHWCKVNTTTLAALFLDDQGDIGGEDVASGAYTFYPAVAVDADNNAGFGFSLSGPSVFPGAYYTARLAGNLPGTVQPINALRPGLDYYYRAFGGARNRWGDYSGMSIDPVDDATFWAFNEYALPRGTVLGGFPSEDGRWGTAFGSFKFGTITTAPGRVWSVRFNGTADSTDVPLAIAADAAGNCFVAGFGFNAAGNADMFVIKYDNAGLKKWSARYDGPGKGEDKAYAICLDNAGNVYIAGASTGKSGNLDAITIQYNDAGVRQWIARHNANANSDDELYDVKFDGGSGNVYVTGYATTLVGGIDFLTLAYNSAGVKQWQKLQKGAGSGEDRAYELALDAAGNVHVTGFGTNVSGNFDFMTVKYKSDGTRLWRKMFNGAANGGDVATDVALDPAGNVFVAGYSKNAAGNDDYLLLKYDANGVYQWNARYNGPGKAEDRAHDVAVDESGNAYVTGRSAGPTNFDYATLKYDDAGVKQWLARYDGPGADDDEANRVLLDGSGNVTVTGASWGSGTDLDFATINYDDAGVKQWVRRQNGPASGPEIANDMALNPSGELFVTGSSRNAAGNDDFLTSMYRPLIPSAPIAVAGSDFKKVLAQKSETLAPVSFQLEQNYPNPFWSEATSRTAGNPTTTISFALPEAGDVSLSIYNMSGQLVKRLVSGEMAAGRHNFTWDATDQHGARVASGVYLYVLKAGEFVAQRKLVLMK